MVKKYRKRKKSYIEKITPFIDRMRTNYEPEEGGDTPVPPEPGGGEIDPAGNVVENVEMDLENNTLTVNQLDAENHTLVL